MAHYVESLLASGEQIIRIHRQHWLTLLDESRLAVLGLAAAVLLFLVMIIANVTGTARDLLGIVTLVLLVLGIARLVWAYLRWTTNEYVLTNRRVMQVAGIVNKRTSDSSLEKINDAILTQSWIGRIFHFGDLEILTASESGIENMHMLVDAAGFKRGMLDAKHELELELARGGVPTPPLRAPGPMVPAGGVARPAAPRRDLEPTLADVPRPGEGVGGVGAPVAAPPRTDTIPVGEPGGSPHGMSPDEVTATLGRLADLRDRGAITPEEYEAKKRDLLARL